MAAETASASAAAISHSSSECLTPTSIPPLADPPLPALVVLLVIGLPAAGKTTFVRRLANCPSVLLHHVCVDDLYNRTLPQHTAAPPTAFSPVLWHAARDAAYGRTAELLRSLPSSAAACPGACRVVCVDDVFHLRSMRHAYYRLCRHQQVPFHQLLISAPLAACLSNLATRSAAAGGAGSVGVVSAAHAQLTAEYVAALSARFDGPTEAEMRYTTVRHSGGDGGSVDCSFLRSAFVPPPAAHPTREPTVALVQSAVHQLDIALRRAIGQRMAEWSAQQRQPTQQPASERDKAAAVKYARDANELRQRLLTDARQRGTAVYEMMQAGDRLDLEHEEEQSRMHVAVQQAVCYFSSLMDADK